MLITFYKLLNVHPGEEKPVLLLLLKGFFMGIFLANYKVVAEAFFLSDLGEFLPQAMFISALVGVFSTGIFAYLQNRITYHKLIIINLSLILLFLASIRILFEFGSIYLKEYLTFILFIMMTPIFSVTLLGFWGIFGRIFDLRQSKRIIGGIDSGQLLGAIITFYSVSLINKYIKNVDFLLVSMIGIILSLLFLVIMVRSGCFINPKIISKKAKVITRMGGLFKNNYVLLLSLFLFFSMLTYSLVAFLFLTSTDIYFPSEESLMSFLGWFNGSIMILSLIIQTFINDRLIAMYGLRTALLVLPVILFICMIAAIIAGSLIGNSINTSHFVWYFLFIAISKLFTDSLRDALENPSFKLFFMPLDVKIRFDIQTKVEGVVNEFSRFISGGLILILGYFSYIKLIHYSCILLFLLVGWVIVTFKLYNEYRFNVKKKLQGHKEVEELHQNYKNSLKKELLLCFNNSKLNLIIFSARLLEKLDLVILKIKLTELITDHRQEYKKFALELLSEYRNSYFHSSAKTLLTDDINNNSDTAANWLEKIKFLQEGKSNNMYDQLLHSDDPQDRKYLINIIINEKQYNLVSYLTDLLNDLDPNVRLSAINAAGYFSNPGIISSLIEQLGSSTYGEKVKNSLVKIGIMTYPFLENSFYRTGQNIQTKLRTIQIYGSVNSPESVELLWNKINYPDKKIVSQVLTALGNCRFIAKGAQVTNIKFAIEGDLSNITWILSVISKTPKDYYGQLLIMALNDEINFSKEHIYMLLSMIFDPYSVQLVKENVESKTGEGLTYAIELLDVFLPDDLKQKIIPLIDDLNDSDRLNKLSEFFPQVELSFPNILQEIINRDYNQINRWTKACAIYNLAVRKITLYVLDLIASLFNPDYLICETVAFALYSIDEKLYHEHTIRLNQNLKRSLDSTILANEKDKIRFSVIMKMFINPFFKNIPGLFISNVVDNFEYIYLKKDQNIKITSSNNIYFYLIFNGRITISKSGNIINTYSSNSLIDEIFLAGNDFCELTSLQDSVIAKFEKDSFYDFLINNITMSSYILKNLVNDDSGQFNDKIPSFS
jgi:ATP/ADP translocase